MDATSFIALALACAPQVDIRTAFALVAVESTFNPHAIGVVGGTLSRQPRHHTEAIATAKSLHGEGWNFSIGLAQINVRNLHRLGLTLETAFDPCANLTAMQSVLSECLERAQPRGTDTGSTDVQHTLRRALSCYYSGNWVTGFEHGYVQRVAQAATRPFTSTPTQEHR
jgi:type IV secretion system protein VirB1